MIPKPPNPIVIGWCRRFRKLKHIQFVGSNTKKESLKKEFVKYIILPKSIKITVNDYFGQKSNRLFTIGP